MRRLVPVAFLLAACSPSPPAESPEQKVQREAAETAEVKRVIDSLNLEFNGAFSSGMGDVVAAQYAPDGELIISGQPPFKGREAIAGVVGEMAKVNAAITTRARSVTRHGPLAVELGDYSLSITPPGARSSVTESGSYMIHWHLVDGQWLRIADVAATTPAPPQ
ncbi:MAG: nuclear transport factor 2 family protein [Gemmatimonadales bacterium]|nr:nuclear transport factor 2 family protein [Gemmatimonadales bacterium]